MSTSTRMALTFAGIGCAVAVLLTAVAYYHNAHLSQYTSEDLAKWDEVMHVFFPPSIGLIATERAGIIGQIFVVCVVSLQNAFLYGLVGWVVGKVIQGYRTGGG